jgi:hypothetical protein
MRIGNWIKSNGEIVKICGIVEGHYVVQGKEQRMCKTWEPVKLTAKVIERFVLPEGYVPLEDRVEVFRNGVIVYIAYRLHELQNIVWILTGEELRAASPK